MAQIEIQNLGFSYPAGLYPVFENINLSLDTNWRLGLVGRNGKGKTTFLHLLSGKLKGTGKISTPEPFSYFPPRVENTNNTALEVAREIIAPFTHWEQEMNRLLADGGEGAISRYGDIEEKYAMADGYTIDEKIAMETAKLGVEKEALGRPFSTLSGGEKVRLLLAAQFLKKNHFMLIDEPTDHLDATGRKIVARWLSSKKGFVLVSHDRAFLNEAVDHILAINRADIELIQGNYDTWHDAKEKRDIFEKAENQKLESSIAHLKAAAAQTERWSDKVERTKYSRGQATYNHGPASVDRGYIGAKAASMMQRSKAIERRYGKEIEQKQSLLKNVEEAEPIQFLSIKAPKPQLVTAQDVCFSFGEKKLFSAINFSINTGDRIAVTGKNGSGKSSLLHLLTGEYKPIQGILWRMNNLVISVLPQETDYLRGSLQEFASANNLELSLFLALLRKLDFEREAFERPVQSYSAGQKKKVVLAASLSKPAHLFIWDEPLNYIDVYSREQIEKAVLDSMPTIIFVEHDALFVKNIATKTIAL